MIQLVNELNFCALASDSDHNNIYTKVESLVIVRCLFDISYYTSSVVSIVFSPQFLSALQRCYALGCVHACSTAYSECIENIFQIYGISFQEYDEYRYQNMRHALLTYTVQDVLMLSAISLITCPERKAVRILFNARSCC